VKPVFGLFENYKDAKAAVNELLERNFDEGEMNVIVLRATARNYMEVTLEKINIDVTEKIGEKAIHGLDRLVGSQQAVRIPDVGEVCAAGKTAVIVARTASTQGADGGGLKSALVDLGLPDWVAEACRSSIEVGGVLFWLRTNDERVAEAANVLNSHKAAYISTYTR